MPEPVFDELEEPDEEPMSREERCGNDEVPESSGLTVEVPLLLLKLLEGVLGGGSRPGDVVV